MRRHDDLLAALDRCAFGQRYPVHPGIDRQDIVGVADHHNRRALGVFGDGGDGVGCPADRQGFHRVPVDPVPGQRLDTPDEARAERGALVVVEILGADEAGGLVVLRRVAHVERRIGDIGAAIQDYTQGHGFGVVRDLVGHGLGKAKEVQEAITKGIEDAKKNLIKVPIINGTVPHEQIGKFGGGNIFLKPAAHGTGVIAGGAMRAVLESAGVTDVLAKSLGSANPHNVVKATIKALGLLREPIQVAKNRTLKLSKVFNG